MTKTRPADIVFVELDRVWRKVDGHMVDYGRWDVRFFDRSNVEGSIYRHAIPDTVGAIMTVREVPNTRYDNDEWGRLVEVPADGTHFEWTTPGATTKNGNRHDSAGTFGRMQEIILAWAGRRFRTVVES